MREEGGREMGGKGREKWRESKNLRDGRRRDGEEMEKEERDKERGVTNGGGLCFSGEREMMDEKLRESEIQGGFMKEE